MASKRLPQAFGIVLRKLRTEVGLSQEDLAHRAGTNQAYVSLLERGQRAPSLVTIALLAKALRIGLTELVGQVEREAGA